MSKSRQPRRITAAYLENAALHYLERFAASAEGLRRVLLRKVRRAALFHGDDEGEGAALVEALVARYLAAGLLDDRLYAELKGRSMLRRGVSVRGIRQRLGAKGVAAALVEDTLRELATAERGAPAAGRQATPDLDHDLASDLDRAAASDLDRAAALAFARRRRLGPYRPAEARALHRLRDLAALGRAGFSYDVARAVVDAEEI